ncbi:hypothetical protein [Solicola sp. PLA-1-18]|uniref:hypothetical protein n=1 Tax=Solicola sp. PLA-1-18 TaxID=3380532 RepID=UPI003B8078D3
MHSFAAAASGLVGLVAVWLLLMPPSTHRLSQWLSASRISDSDATLSAVRGALARMGHVGTLFLGGAAVLGLALQLKISAGAVAVPFAVVASASVRLDGGHQRVARISPDDAEPVTTNRLFWAGTVVAAAVIGLTAAITYTFGRRSEPSQYPNFSLGTTLPDVTQHSLLIVGGLSVLLLIGAWLGQARVTWRPSMTCPDPGADRALRLVCSRRLAAGLLGGQTILLGIAASAAPVFAPSGAPPADAWLVDESLTDLSSASGLLAVAIGLCVIVAGLAEPWWTARHRAASTSPAPAAGSR